MELFPNVHSQKKLKKNIGIKLKLIILYHLEVSISRACSGLENRDFRQNFLKI